MPEQAAIRIRTRALLTEVLQGSELVDKITDNESLRLAGVSSPALIGLLVRLEQEYDFEWDDNVEADVLRDIASLSAHVNALRTG